MTDVFKKINTRLDNVIQASLTSTSVKSNTQEAKEDTPSWMEVNSSSFSNDDKNGAGTNLNAQGAASKAGVRASNEELGALCALANGKTDGATYQYDINGDGSMEKISLKEWMETTQDCELDLYANEMMVEFFEEFGTRTAWDDNGNLCWGGIFQSQKKGKNTGKTAQQWLDEHHLKVTMLNNRNFVFNVVDNNGEIIKNKDGKTGEAMFFDGLIADGYAQGAEQHLAEILDNMGLDMLSKADFKGSEAEYDKLMQSVLSDIKTGKYESTGKTAKDLYGTAQTLGTAFSYYDENTTILQLTLLQLMTSLNDETINGTEKKQLEKEQTERIKKYALAKIDEGYSITSVINTTKGKFGNLSETSVNMIKDLYETHEKEKLASEKEDKNIDTELKNEENEQISKKTNENVLKEEEKEREEELAKIA